MRSFAPRKLQVMPNLTPLMDVALLLIATFLALGPLFTRQFPLALPPVEVRAATQGMPPNQVVVRVDANSLTLNGAPIAENMLEEALRTSLAGQRNPVVIFDAQLELPYERVAVLLDIFQRAGAKSVGLASDLGSHLPPIVNTTEVAP